MATYNAPLDDMMFLFEKLRDNPHYNDLEKSLIKILDKYSTVLVKGSRSMKMERIVNTLMADENKC